MAKDDVLYANPANYVVDVIGEGHPDEGLAARLNPWRQLSSSEFNALMVTCATAFRSAPTKIMNGVQTRFFSCSGYSFLVQLTASGNYAFVYNHPGQVVFNMKQYERPAVPSRRPTALRGVPHWPGLGEPELSGPNNDMGVGAYATLPNPQNRPEINAAIDFLAYYDANGCSRSSLPVVTALQNAYNASGLPGQLTLDGEYGPNSQRALQNIMDEAQADAGAGPSQQAPANCFPEYGNVPSIPALDVTPTSSAPSGGSGTYTAPVTTVTGSASSSKAALLVGGAIAAVAGGAGIYYWRKHHKRGR